MAKHLAPAVLSTVFLCGLSLAQSQTPSSAGGIAQSPQSPAAQAPGASPTAGNQSQASSPRIAPGVVIPVRLSKTVDAKKAKPGDEVVATVTTNLKTNSGEMIVPKDTKIVGRVTTAQARTKEQKESDLGIAFDRAVTKHGELKQAMSIQAIIAPLDNTSENDSGNNPGGPVTGGGTATSPMGGRNSPMEGSGQPQPRSTGATAGADAPAEGNARPPINANTQGVIGMPELKLEASAQNAAQGSVISSGKNNVKLESGTLMLLRVNP
ncbi:MAG TPA: hypothetical protein VKR60_02480 [Candidatus Sulfotelmatobacter sp.]|nr:hypothetical protein [Candidatus Sulfotelmatobacter sp.]